MNKKVIDFHANRILISSSLYAAQQHCLVLGISQNNPSYAEYTMLCNKLGVLYVDEDVFLS